MTSSGELSATTKAQALVGLEVSGGKILAAWKREKKENGLFSTEHLRVIHHDFHHGFQHTKYIRRWDLTNKMKMVKNRVYNMAKYGEFTMKIDKEKNVDLTMKKRGSKHQELVFIYYGKCQHFTVRIGISHELIINKTY